MTKIFSLIFFNRTIFLSELIYSEYLAILIHTNLRKTLSKFQIPFSTKAIHNSYSLSLIEGMNAFPIAINNLKFIKKPNNI